MYYRYKSKEKNNSFTRILIMLPVLLFLIWLVYSQRERLMFWKMSEHKIASILSRESDGESTSAKIERLRTLEKSALKNSEKLPYNVNGNYMYATILFGLGSALSDLDFSQYCIMSGEKKYSDESLQLYYRAIRLIRKGAAVDENRPLPDDVLIKLAYMYYVTAYYQADEIAELIEGIESPQLLSDVHERRFYSYLLIKGGAVDEGIAFLQQYGAITLFTDKLFLAAMYADAGQYTDAINLYSELRREAPEASSRKKISRSLGDLFFRQMLYSEALAQYTALLQESPDDPGLKKAIGETYTAMGDKENAALFLRPEAAAPVAAVNP